MAIKSDHFNGKEYYNPHVNARGIKEVLHWLWNRNVAPWPHRKIKPQPVKFQKAAVGELWVTFINHSTVLIQVDGWNILTDPIWSKRASPFARLGPQRVHEPGINFSDLPPIDFVLVSHNHYDHLDIATLKSLEKKYHPHFYTSKGNQPLLESIGLKKVKEFDWWESIKLSYSREAELYCVPAQHFSGRGIFDRNKTLWSGFVFKSLSKTIYFAGDTGYSHHFKEIQKRLGCPTLALLPIGPFKPEWFMHPVHLSPKEAVQAHCDLSSKQSLAIHFGTFQLGDEGIDEAPLELEKELKKQGLSLHSFWVLNPGEGRKVHVTL
jgi:L-ascorbate metabolism protein UlaG (beta-lactamase superfamily)